MGIVTKSEFLSAIALTVIVLGIITEVCLGQTNQEQYLHSSQGTSCILFSKEDLTEKEIVRQLPLFIDHIRKRKQGDDGFYPPLPV